VTSPVIVPEAAIWVQSW